MKMALECENDDVVEDSLSSSSNDSDLHSKKACEYEINFNYISARLQ